MAGRKQTRNQVAGSAQPTSGIGRDEVIQGAFALFKEPLSYQISYRIQQMVSRYGTAPALVALRAEIAGKGPKWTTPSAWRDSAELHAANLIGYAGREAVAAYLRLVYGK